ncbi:MAG: HAD family hydrolase [Phycisphaerae bacterium]|nr:HAD family hydrolase [Phycisphaerae bacterium]
MAHRRYDALFIDFYGTITGGDKLAVEETCRLVVDRLGLSLSPPELAITWGQRFFAALDTANDGAFRNLFELECETLIETLETMIGPFDPVPFVRHLKRYWADPRLQPEAIESLKAIEVPICCVSNADTEDILAAVEKNNLPIDHIVTSEDARSYKPHAAIFRKALAEMKVSADRVIHVGDSLHSDVRGAQPLGIATVWIRRDERIFDVGKAHPDHQVGSLLELPSLIA